MKKGLFESEWEKTRATFVEENRGLHYLIACKDFSRIMQQHLVEDNICNKYITITRRSSLTKGSSDPFVAQQESPEGSSCKGEVL